MRRLFPFALLLLAALSLATHERAASAVVGVGPMLVNQHSPNYPPDYKGQYGWYEGDHGFTVGSAGWGSLDTYNGSSPHNCVFSGGTSTNIVLTPGAINGHAAVTWTSQSVEAYLGCPPVFYYSPPGMTGGAANAWTYGFVFNYTGSFYSSTWYDNQQLWGSSAAYYEILTNPVSSGSSALQITVANSDDGSSNQMIQTNLAAGSIGVWHYVVVQLNGGVMSMSVDGGAAATVSTTQTWLTNASTVMGDNYVNAPTTTGRWQGSVAEANFWPVGTVSMLALENYYATKYNLVAP